LCEFGGRIAWNKEGLVTAVEKKILVFVQSNTNKVPTAESSTHFRESVLQIPVFY
jgi:hypothetical protein